MKNMVKRIIIGIIIGLVLMCARKYLFISANAMEVTHVNPDGMAYCLLNSNCASNQMNTYSPDGLFTTFYGFGYGSYTRENVYWAFPSAGTFNTPVDIHFTIYNQNVYDDDIIPFQVMIKDDNGSLFTCNVNSSNSTLNVGSSTRTSVSLYTNVLCENIALSSSRFRVILGSRFDTGFTGNGVVAISPLTIYEHSSTSAITGAISSGSQAVADSVDSVNDTMSSEEEPDTNDFFESISPDESNSPVSDLITMPITLLQNINNNINGSCSSWNLGNLLGTNLVLPCLHLDTLLGSYLYNLIDMAICLFLAYNIGLMCVTIYNNVTSLKDDFDSMYSPKHTYQPKHGGDD